MALKVFSSLIHVQDIAHRMAYTYGDSIYGLGIDSSYARNRFLSLKTPFYSILGLIHILPAWVKAFKPNMTFPQRNSSVGNSAFFPATLRTSQCSLLALAVIQWCQECYRSLTRPRRSVCMVTPPKCLQILRSFSVVQVQTELKQALLHSSSIYG